MRGPDWASIAEDSRLAIVASNLVPIAGVVVLGWSTATVLAIYLLELAAVVFWTGLKIPFAEKRPQNAIDDRFPLFGPLQEKRGGLALSRWLPPAYPRNVPSLIGLAGLGALELLVGFSLFALTRPEITASVVGAAVFGGVAVFAARGVETWIEYVRDGGYREHSPRSLLLVPLKQFFGVGFLFVFLLVLEAGIPGDAPAVAGRAVVAIVALGKLAYDLRARRLRRDPDRRGLFAKLYGSKRTEIDPVPVETPDADPRFRVSLSRRVAALDALAHGLDYGMLRRGIVVVPFVALGVFAGSTVLVGFGLALGLVLTGLRGTTRYLRHGTLEHRCHDGVLVVHDTLLGEPQDRIERDDVTNASVSRGWVDRLLDTETLTLDRGSDERPTGLFAPAPEEIDGDDLTGNGPVYVPHVSDARDITDALGVSWYLDRGEM